MGSLCSKSSTHTGGHTVLDGAAPPAQPVRGQPAPAADPRSAAAAAAEQRRKAEQKRGTNASNPNRGRLTSQMEASRAAAKLPEQRQEERVVVRPQPLSAAPTLTAMSGPVGLIACSSLFMTPRENV
ncbi:hypothetical protein FA95DRAFT_1484869 [Auriscalpium vulgare]|uniref:Uncharacterized protein n=1 Tax=Auriscalpium vulgare TaxID=40419 RepID=A0ACB8S7C1_9AGAM|nr:hypothetical protein FA95DRAFT_1484869 [Auriscalpium vulgare]